MGRMGPGREVLNAAPGTDEVPPGLLACLSDDVLHKLFVGFKDRVQGIDGELIDDWRSFGAVCIPKASGDLRSLQRWRIICLASALFKWYEIFLFKHLENICRPALLHRWIPARTTMPGHRLLPQRHAGQGIRMATPWSRSFNGHRQCLRQHQT